MNTTAPYILYEGDDIVAVYKPSGLIMHPDGRTDEPHLAAWVQETFPETESVGEPLCTKEGASLSRPGIVHRIDRDTSGVVLIARTEPAYKYLKRQFKDHDIRKTYRAFVYGKITQSRGSIRRPIGRSKNDFRKYSAERGVRGTHREAITVYNLISAREDASYLTVIPQTGRTHQIRVHLKAVHHPVVCDLLYASSYESLLGFTRLALHAHTISFCDTHGEDHTITAPLPDDFCHAEKLLGV